MYKKLKKTPIALVEIMFINCTESRNTEVETQRLPSRKNLVKNSMRQMIAETTCQYLSYFLDFTLDVMTRPPSTTRARTKYVNQNPLTSATPG